MNVNGSNKDCSDCPAAVRLSIGMLKMCDYIYMMRGWNESCGLNREYGYALATGNTIIRE